MFSRVLRRERHEVAEPRQIPANPFAERKFHRRPEDRPVEHEAMKFSVLAAGIDRSRQVGEEAFVDDAARKVRIEPGRIDADDYRLEV